MTGRRQFNRGFALLDMLVCLLIVLIMMVFSIPLIKFKDYTKLAFYHEYLYNQSLSLVNKKEYVFNGVIFNEKGNVKHAETLNVEGDIYVVELGTGKLVKK